MEWNDIVSVGGYVAAFLLGVICTLQSNIMKNSAQIRRNSETIRKNSEAAWAVRLSELFDK